MKTLAIVAASLIGAGVLAIIAAAVYSAMFCDNETDGAGE